MSPFENFRHTHNDHQPGSAVALHLEPGETLPPAGVVGRLAHSHDTGLLSCDEGEAWQEVQGAAHDHPHDHDGDYAPGRVLTASEVTTLDDYLANADPTLADTVAAVKALASVLRQTT